MDDWMAYLYMQKPLPADATGVTVTLTAIDPNGNTQNIGTATTDTNGNYGIMWAPPVEGTYKITATFAGTNGYYGSDATTYIGVDVAPSPVPTIAPSATAEPTIEPTIEPTPTPTASPSVVPEPEAQPSTDIYIIAAAAAVVLVVVAIAAVLLKKRK